MIRSVTVASVGFRAIGLLVPADAVALSQRDRRRWTPGAGRIRTRRDPLLHPGGADAVDPRPLRLHLVAADEQCRVALDQIEQQPLVRDPPAILAECIGEADVEGDFTKAYTMSIQARSLGHNGEADRLLGLESDHQSVRLCSSAARGK